MSPVFPFCSPLRLTDWLGQLTIKPQDPPIHAFSPSIMPGLFTWVLGTKSAPSSCSAFDPPSHFSLDRELVFIVLNMEIFSTLRKIFLG